MRPAEAAADSGTSVVAVSSVGWSLLVGDYVSALRPEHFGDCLANTHDDNNEKVIKMR